MVPGLDQVPLDIKKGLEELTMVEEMLISPILAIMSIYRLPGGALINRGFCANFQQDIQPLVYVLPRLPKDIPLLILKKKDQENNVKQFLVNRYRVQTVLKYLCEFNPAYKNHGIKINTEALNLLPENSIPVDLPSAVDHDCTVESYILETGPNLLENDLTEKDDENIEVFVESDDITPIQMDYIKTTINFPTADKNPINEFQMESICSLLFPKLFPNGMGDPTTIGVLI